MSELSYRPLEPLSKLEIKKRLERGKEDELVLFQNDISQYLNQFSYRIPFLPLQILYFIIGKFEF